MEGARPPVRHLQGRDRPLDGRVTVPGTRWVTGEESRRRVHELRAAVGRGRGRHGNGAGGRAAARRARRSGRRGSRAGSPSGAGRCPPIPTLELRSGDLAEELAALAAEGVQSLLLEGGPTLATAFLEAGLVDKLLLFVAPTLSGDGPRFLGDLSAPRATAPRLDRARSATISSSRPTLAREAVL